MKLKSNKLMLSLIGLVMAAMPFTNASADAHGETFNIYGWQNWSYEYVEADRTFENNRYFEWSCR